MFNRQPFFHKLDYPKNGDIIFSDNKFPVVNIKKDKATVKYFILACKHYIKFVYKYNNTEDRIYTPNYKNYKHIIQNTLPFW